MVILNVFLFMLYDVLVLFLDFKVGELIFWEFNISGELCFFCGF